MSNQRDQDLDHLKATNLAALPTEIIQQIASHIPISGLIALKLTTRNLFFQLPSPPPGYIKSASDCEKRAVRRFVAERYDISGGRRKCILCEGLMPEDFYCGRAEPVCKWHHGWFERVLVARGLPDGYFEDVGARERRIRTLCGHCKEIRGWDVDRCACQASGGGCESCGSWEVVCRVRLVEDIEIE